MPIPLATYRLQFNHEFTFKQAIDLVDYLYELGISDIYASPVMKARADSMHGYDAIDLAKINPEVGTEEELAHLATLLQEKGMGIILDIVPNHMCIADSGNRWWADLLENGSKSIYAGYFDIYWDHHLEELKGKVLLPILAQPLGKVLESLELKVFYKKGIFFLDYLGRSLPLSPKSWSLILEEVLSERNMQEVAIKIELEEIIKKINTLDLYDSNSRHKEKESIKRRMAHLDKHSFFQEAVATVLHFINSKNGIDFLEKILKEQAYRLSYWRLTNNLINYRRFFEINDLACLHTECLKVFEAVHHAVFNYIAHGWIRGLRLDHVDGLYDPKQYLIRLQKKQPRADGIYTIVEKILVGPEKLPGDWPVQGTSGYDYLNLLNGLFVVPEHRYLFQQLYDQFIGFRNVLDEITYDCKKLILSFSMASELSLLTYRLERISEQHRTSYDFSHEHLHNGLREVIACFPVYRTYIGQNDRQVSKEDQNIILAAITKAKALNSQEDHLVFDFIESVLLLQYPHGLTSEQIQFRKEFVFRFQQLTGPVMAKGFEDTALYRAYPLASLNDVGMNAKSFGIQPGEFHSINHERQQKWPYTLLSTSTHDTKRSEDVRARINVLSENPHIWKEAVQSWRRLNKDKKLDLDYLEVPDWNIEYLLYQTLVGTWTSETQPDYLDRIQKYMVKALKEAKIHSSWIQPHEEYENSLTEFIARILDRSAENPFLSELELFAKPLVKAGRLNSLSQVLLKIMSPGIPDFYQGSEFWQLTLVDPDNRQPVDYFRRKQALRTLKDSYTTNPLQCFKELWQEDEGSLKMLFTWIALNFRKAHPELFQLGEYLPIQSKSQNIVAFARKYQEQVCIIVVGRFFTRVTDLNIHWPPIDKVWKNEEFVFPPSMYGTYKDVLSGTLYTIDASIKISSLFSHLPFVLLANY